MSDRNRRGSRSVATFSKQVQDTFVRPSDTNIYAAGDVISATVSDTATTPLRSLSLAAAPGKPFWLAYLALRTNLDTFLFTPRIHFYNTAAPTTPQVGDNVALARYYANVAQYLGYADLPILTDVGDMAASESSTIRLLLQPLDTEPSSLTNPMIKLVYYRIEVFSGTPTPASGQSFTLVARSLDA